jgi:hypothetical protein
LGFWKNVKMEDTNAKVQAQRSNRTFSLLKHIMGHLDYALRLTGTRLGCHDRWPGSFDPSIDCIRLGRIIARMLAFQTIHEEETDTRPNY